jgi:hypothetical protein
MRKLLITCIAIIHSFVLYSNNITSIIVHTYSGKETIFNISDETTASMNGSNVIIKNSSIEIVFPISEGVSITFSNQESLNIKTDCIERENYSIRDNKLYCKNIVPRSNIYLFSLDGRQLECEKTDDEGKAVLLLNKYNNQIIVVKTSNKSFKIIRK